jgi:Methylmalonyl Co-A mutase-associated GTPase MeaB
VATAGPECSSLQDYLLQLESEGYIAALADRVRAGDRHAVSRAITLCESTRLDHVAHVRRQTPQRRQQGRALQTNYHQRAFLPCANHASLGVHPSMHSCVQAADLMRRLSDPAGARTDRADAHPADPREAFRIGGRASRHSGAAGTVRSGPRGEGPKEAPQGQTDRSDGPQRTLRVGVTGPPGVGKSSLIEALGCAMVGAAERVAVLAIDPSSERSGGAILGDKTRMPRSASQSVRQAGS